MISAECPVDEAKRLRALYAYEVLDTEPELGFDQLTELASNICGTPIALVSLVDSNRQWFKSHYGLDAKETPRSVAFCSHAILQDEVFEVVNSFEDERFHDNPLVTGAPNVVSYAGAPLKTPDGDNIGTLCVIGHEPKVLTGQQRTNLKILADQVVSQLELRKSLGRQNELFHKQMDLIDRINFKNSELSQFAYRTSHDLKAPVVRMQALAEFCLKDLQTDRVKDVAKNIEFIVDSCKNLAVLVEDIIELTRADLKPEAVQAVNIEEALQRSLLDLKPMADERGVDIEHSVSAEGPFPTQATRLHQILYNLISNSVKYANPSRPRKLIQIDINAANGSELRLEVKDNGLGIPQEFHSRVFDMFERFHPNAASGSGLGTSIMKKHVDALNGSVRFESDPAGTRFQVEIPRSELECAA